MSWWETHTQHWTCFSASLFSFSFVGNLFTDPLWSFKVKCLCRQINVCADTNSISAPWMSMRQACGLFHWPSLVPIRPSRAAKMNENSKQIKKIMNKWEGNEAFVSVRNWWQQNTLRSHAVTSKWRFVSEALPAAGRSEGCRKKKNAFKGFGLDWSTSCCELGCSGEKKGSGSWD